MWFAGLTVAAPTATEAEPLTASLKVTGVTGAANVKSIHQKQIAISHLIGIEI